MAGRIAAGTHERRIARRLESRGLPGLAEALVGLRGCVIASRWRVESLSAVGAEGAVFVVCDVRDRAAPLCVAKLPLLPFHRPAELSSSLLRHRRDALREESQHLSRSMSAHMPESLGLYEFENPLLDRRRGGAFAEPDPALVMERLAGIDVDLWLARVHRSGLSKDLLRSHLDRIVVVVLQALLDLQERGFYYADLRPGNLRMMARPHRHVRLLDAGSLVEVTDTSGRFPHVPHYLPPELFERRYLRDEPIVPTAAVQAVMAGRTLHEVATGHVPMPGRPVAPLDPRDAGLSAAVADVVDGLASGSFTSVRPALKYLARRATKRAAPPVPQVSAPLEFARAPAAGTATGAAGVPAAPAPHATTVAAPAAPQPVTSAAHAAARPWWRRIGSAVAAWLGARRRHSA